ncbi:AT-rich interactive domain-containing protein 5B-like [Cydia splendana]|uniref:AT-rich interactive domain-containing protein 5B-like n=1 Tax=Cydia splendana TaxID=1100963 RepID=UPI00300C8B1C
MDKPSFKLVGAPCGQHGQYTFYKALRISGRRERIIAIGDFFFVRIWQDSELVSIGELQLLWTDRVSDQTLVSLRLYFLPENTPDGRHQHGQDEVLAINDKVVLKAEDLLSWVCGGEEWRWGLRAVWRGDCAPPAHPRRSQPLHHTRLDFSDVEKEKNAISEDAESPGVVVFSYPRYCRYRALLSRLEGIQGDWLRDSLVCALGGYAAPTKNTRILYCKDTFEYPELEGHEFVCNQLAPKLKGRPRGRRRKRASNHSPSLSDRSSDSDSQKRVEQPAEPQPPRRLSLRNGAPGRGAGYSDDDDKEASAEDRTFLDHLKHFYKQRGEAFKPAHSLKDLSLRALYHSVTNAGGYESACRHKLWRQIHPPQPNTARRHYERFLLPLEKHEVSVGLRTLPKLNGAVEQPTVTIELADSREPSPVPKEEAKDFSVTSKPAEELNREFLDSLPPKEENKVRFLTYISLVLSETRRYLRVTIELADSREPSPGPKEEAKDFSVTSKPAEELNREFLDSLPPKEENKVRFLTFISLVLSQTRRYLPGVYETVRVTIELADSREPSPVPKEEAKDISVTSKPAEELNREFLDSLPPKETVRVTIELADSREPSPVPKGEAKDFSVTSKPAEELNREFLDSLPPKDENKMKISVKPVEKLLEEPKKEKQEPQDSFYSELKAKLNLGNADSKFLTEIATAQQELVSSSALSSLSSLVNGHTLPKDQSRPAGATPAGGGAGAPTRSSLRAVRVKPARAQHNAPASTPPGSLRPDSASSSPPASVASGPGPVTNFGIHHPPPPPAHSDDEIVEVPYKPKTPEIIDLDEYPESPQAVKKKKLDILKERGLEVTALPGAPAWPPTPPAPPLPPLVLAPAVQHQIMTQAQIFQMYNIIPPAYPNGAPPKVIQATSAFGSSGPEKTVYGNPKDPFMPPPHVLLGTPLKPQRNSTAAVPSTPPQDILDLTCKTVPKPAVEIVRIPSVPSPSKVPPQNLTKNYTLIDGKAVVGSNLEITLVNPKSQTPTKSRQQKRSSNGKFVPAKTPTPPKEYPKSYTSPSQSKKPPIVVPNYQVNPRDDVSPTSSTGSGNSQTNLLQNNMLQNVFKGQNSLQQMMDMQKNVPSMPYVDPMYMSALYSSLAGSMDQRQLAMYRDFMANQFRGYSGLLGVTPTTKN